VFFVVTSLETMAEALCQPSAPLQSVMINAAGGQAGGWRRRHSWIVAMTRPVPGAQMKK
jgi:hypothetical protein